MALLIPAIVRRTSMRHKIQAVAALVALTVLGCAILGDTDKRGGPAFSHRRHIQEKGLTCTFCHGREIGGLPPARPERDLCLICHVSAEEAPMIAAYFQNWELNRPSVGAQSDELNFQHAQHSVSLGDCSLCHVGIEESESIELTDRVSMRECMDCHEERGQPNECATCHKEIDRDWAPTNHSQSWTKMHGQVARMRSQAIEESCALCHSESTCTQCHSVTEPESHNNFFRLRGHGLHASMDRDSCAACHRTDFCTQCHQETTPLSHRGSWGSPTNQHCFGCHLPLQAESCITCHKSTPSHDMAAPKPPDHFASMNCRQCHGVTQPLPHVDNGSDCNFCHH